MIKFLLALTGATLLGAPAVFAQRGHAGGVAAAPAVAAQAPSVGGGRAGMVPHVSSFGPAGIARPSMAARPSSFGRGYGAYRGAYGVNRGIYAANRGTYAANRGAYPASRANQTARAEGRHGDWRDGDGRHGDRDGDWRGGRWGQYYYLGGVPFFYPFYGYGFGYPYYGGYAGYYGSGDYATANVQTEVNNSEGDQPAPPDGGSLPQAVQHQLASKGYYHGAIDGQFGPASRSALSRFQKDNGLKQTGRIDQATLEALGFSDHR